ncbi:MIP/aquaporin family protein [Thalassoroseus pseudoceratinae]|uniref:MIP/aquaporin family protein n=1 Tax=Thalassoroseus pseudoceratinae TaxID=2713176 RepID=UPI00141FDD09|nr:aquaporin [Thalassoroseus pseudoceratinae]
MTVNQRKYLAEVIGTFALVFTGTGAIVVNQAIDGQPVTHPGIALTFGLIVMSVIYAIGDVSGAHINPAVTIAFTVAGRFPGSQVLPYILSQCIGGLAASGLLRVMFPAQEFLGGTLPAGSWSQSFIFEVVLTFMLMYVVLRVSSGAKEKGIMAGVAIGSVVALEAMFAGPVCGASMNPARSLAPAVVSGHLESLWIYLTAPVIGAVLAIPASDLTTLPDSDEPTTSADQAPVDAN